ncbi:hypothetical protein M9458_052078 [Cirrhinus mrigala]|uniref:ribonuclease H n=1 Tax=Cirrhinus mrigala TaxID=683832 RepID=A0ABD0MTN8_CIRMR
MQVGALHNEIIQFYTIQSPHHTIILGLPWLHKHDPRISWRDGEIRQWSATCPENCLPTIRPLRTSTPPLSELSPDAVDLSSEYEDLKMAFSKEKASQLPRHRSVDCAIELLPGQSPPKGLIFPLSQPESEAMSNYIKEELAKGFICPSTSPASAGFFFVKKKDGSLRPCIDYRGLIESFMNDVFRDMLDKWVIIYIDDILIYSDTLSEHIQHIRTVLKRLTQYQLYAKLEKFEFHRTSTSFFGYIISQEGVAMDEKKVEAVLKWPQPRTLKELQRFLGFTNFYRRFIQNFSSVAAPLTAMTKRQTTRLTWSPEALHAFDELRNRKLLAMKLVLEEWRHWLEGAKHPFTILTDHKNLEYRRSAKRLNPRQARCTLFFTRFQFTVTYRPGSKNTKADALSRQAETSPHPDHQENIIPTTLLLAPVQWDTEIEQANQQQPPPSECLPGKLFVPETLRHRLLSQVHRVPSSAINFITDLPNSQGNTLIFTIIDRFSKACRLISLPKLPSAFEAAKLLCNHVFRLYGLPEDTVSDRGPQFTSRVWSSFLKLLNVNVSLTSGYHPQSNGQTERLNQEIVRFLRSYCHNNQSDWSRYLTWAEYAQNSLVKPATGITQFQCILGYQPPMFLWSGEPSNLPSVTDWLHRSEETWDQAYTHLSRAIRKQTRTANQHRCPGPRYTPGQWVWLSTRDLRLKLPCKKLSPRYVGPFQIIKEITPVSFHLDLPANYHISPTFHMSLLKPAGGPRGELEEEA